VAIRHDHQDHAIVIASCEAHDLKQGVASLPNAFAKTDNARYAAACEIAAAAAARGEAELYGTYHAAAASMTESRRNNDRYLQPGRCLVVQALAYAGHADQAVKEVEQIADADLRLSAWLTIIEVQAFRSQTDDAMANVPKISDHPESPLTCCFIAETGTSLRKLDQWQTQLPADQRAGVLAGLAQRTE
jgi:hypothetical protein